MGSFDRFEDIEVWKNARVLLKDVYKVSSTGSFSRDFNMRNQFRSAALSIMNNISEGNDREGNKEFVQFLYIARGSAGEVRSMLYSALDLGYIDESTFKKMKTDVIEISKMTRSLAKYLKYSTKKGTKYKNQDPEPELIRIKS